MRSCVALALLMALLVPATRAQAQAGPFHEPAAGDLFVLTAASGTLERVPGRSRVFNLVLRQTARDVTTFTDRPARRAGEQPLRRFVRGWSRLGFGAVPPNAALVLADAPSKRDVLVVELAKPRLGRGGQTLAFRVKVLRGSPADPLREFAKRADRRVADRFGRVSLFVDASGQEVGLSFSFSGIPSGATVAIGFSNAQVDVTAVAATDLFLESLGGQALFKVVSNGFEVVATGSSLTAQVVIGLNVEVGAASVEGTATIPGAADANVTVLSTNGAFDVANGTFAIPLG